MAFFMGAILLLLALLTIGFLLFLGFIYYTHLKYDHIPGPPRDNFFLGHLPTLIKLKNNNIVIYEPFFEWMERYGPIIRLNYLHKVLIFPATPDAVRDFLMSPKYTKDEVYDDMHSLYGVRFMGNGLVSDRNYDHWHKQRRIMDPAFSKTSLLGTTKVFNEKTEELMNKLAALADWKCRVRIVEMMNRLTLDVIATVAYGMELNAIHDDQTPFLRAFSIAMLGMAEMRNPLTPINPFKQTMIWEVRKNVAFLRNTGKEVIEERMKALQDGEDIPKDILTQILKAADLEGGCTMEDFIDNFVTFFFAGQETTANQLSFAILELGRHPEILARAQAEVDEVIGSKRDIGHEDLGKLQYVSQVLKETLRLYPIAPGTARKVEEETFIDGVRIPAGSSVVLSTYILSRMSKYYPDPLVFNPDRFHPDVPKPAYTYFPFSLGPRICLGQVFAQMEAKVVLAKFLQRYEFELVEGQSFNIVDTGTLHPVDGVMCRLRPRGEHKASKK